jgi:hypothetical protein
MVKILFLAANPSEAAWLSTGREAAQIQARLRSSDFRDEFEVHQHHALTARELGPVLMQVRPDVVHFSGHGTPAGRLIFEGPDPMGSEVNERALTELFRIVADDTRLVILNACYSDAQANLIARYIDAVIGMSSEFDDDAAVEFASALYEALGNGASLRKAFDYAINQLTFTDFPDEDKPQLISREGISAEDIRLAGEPAANPCPPPRRPVDMSARGLLISDRIFTRLHPNRGFAIPTS